MREKRPGVWKVRVFTGSDAHGRPTQLSRTVHGGERDAQRIAAQLEASGDTAKSAGRSVGDVACRWRDERWPAASATPTQR